MTHSELRGKELMFFVDLFYIVPARLRDANETLPLPRSHGLLPLDDQHLVRSEEGSDIASQRDVILPRWLLSELQAQGRKEGRHQDWRCARNRVRVRNVLFPAARAGEARNGDTDGSHLDFRR